MSSVTQEIKDRLDLVDYIQKYVPLKKAGRTYKACCPFHSEKTPSFVVDPDKQYWRCYGACAEGGDIFNFTMKYNGMDFKDALAHLADIAGVQLRQQTPAEKEHDERLDKLRGLLAAAADSYHAHLMDAPTPDAQTTLAYAREKRGLTDETLRRFQVGYAPPGWQNMLNQLLNIGYSEDDVIEAGIAIRNDKGRVYDRFRNRLMIPIRDERGRVVGFGGRALDPEDKAKYINSPQSDVFDKSHLLFGLDTAKNAIREQETVVIVEGYLDAIQAQQAGYHNVVAQMGTALTEPQLKLVAPRHAKKIVMALDSDAAGQNATRRSLETARQALEADYMGRLSVDIRVLQMPGAKDPDDLIRESPASWEGLVADAMPVAKFVIELETADLPDDASVPEREAVARRVLPILTLSENNLYTSDNLQQLARRLRFPYDELEKWAAVERRKNPVQRNPVPAPQDDGPPPLDVDKLQPPPSDWDDEGVVPVPPEPHLVVLDSPGTAPTPEPSFKETTETICLRGLLINPDFLYEVNRKLRELAAGDAALMNGPLDDLSSQDFVQLECRQLMDMLLEALDQYDLEVMDYLNRDVHDDLRHYMDDLLQSDIDHVRNRMRRRFEGDVTMMWKDQERRGRTPATAANDLMFRVLGLRVQRLKRELDEMRFIQQDALEAADEDAAIQVGFQIGLVMRAKQVLDTEMSRQKSVIMS